jgi:hypothetical protein
METDRLLTCPYCRVKSFLTSPDMFRFILPGKNTGPETVYAPYLRFKGALYTINGLNLRHRLADLTARGVDLPFLPPSLGLRPQAMKLQFVARDLPGRFLHNGLTVADLLGRAAGNPAVSGDKLGYQAQIGEAVNLIYLPLHVTADEVLDAITGNVLCRHEDPQTLFPPPLLDEKIAWQPGFLPTLCPACGWDLDGERDSVVLFCRNCDTAWSATAGNFSRLPFTVEEDQAADHVYLPFWNITARTEGRLTTNSFADFIRLTNQPMVVQTAWEQLPMRYLVPAFKIVPKYFLRLASRLTIGLRHDAAAESIPMHGLHPVTLPVDEAVQSLPLILAAAAISRTKVLPYLAAVDFTILNLSLLFLPFQPTSHELLYEKLGIIVNKNTLHFGRQL